MMKKMMMKKKKKAKKKKMRNVKMIVKGNILIIEVDLSRSFGPSNTGKSIITASTQGFVPVPGSDKEIIFSVYRKISKPE